MRVVKVFGIIVTLILIVAIALPFFVDLNNYKPYIAFKVRETTGRDLTIKGDINLSVLPWLGLRLTDVTLSNAKGFDQKQFVAFKTADVKVKLLPLMRKQVEVATILLEDMTLNLMKSKAGATNWQDLTQPNANTKQSEKTNPSTNLTALAIEGIQIKNATINWTDQSNNTHQTLQGFNLSTGAVAMNRPIDVKGSFDIKSNTPPMNGNVALHTKLTIDPATQEFELEPLVIDIKARNNSLPKEVIVHLSSSIKANLAKETLAISNMKMQIDQSTLKGNASIQNFSTPAIKFNLNLDNLNVDSYLTASKKESDTTTPSTTAASKPFPLDALRKLNIDGTFSANTLDIAKLRLQNIHTKLNSGGGLIMLDPLTVNLYDGTYSGKIRIDARGSALHIATINQAQNIQAGTALKDYMGKDVISGVANVDAKLSVAGNESAQLLPSLTGAIEFKFKNGVISGFNIAKTIRNAKIKLKGQTPADANEVVQTDFSELAGSASVTNGIINTQQLEMKTPLLRVTGKGSADLVTQGLDFAITAILVSTLKGQDGAELEDLRGIPVPIKVGGTFTVPKLKLDLKSLYDERAKAKVDAAKTAIESEVNKRKQQEQQRIEQQRQELQDKAKNKLNDQLKKLF